MSKTAVKVHCGSAHVRGRARQYRYYVASLFRPVRTAGGMLIYRNAGVSTSPRRSLTLCQRDARNLAAEHGADFVEGYGSLHNRPAPEETACTVG